jgi:hypothetical protein
MYFSILKKIKKLLLNSSRPEICRDIRVPAQQHGWLHVNVHEAIDQFVISNLGDDLYSQQDFQSHQDYRRPQTLVAIPWGRVRDDIGFVFLPDGSVCAEGNWWEPYMVKNPAYSDRFRSQKKIQGDVFTLLGMWSQEYYHWFHDTLPKVWNSLPHLPKGCRFLINQKPKGYQMESLHALGITENRLLFMQYKGDLLVERLWFSTPHGYTTFSGPYAIQEIANKISASIRSSNSVPCLDKRIYISRSSAKTRRITNETEILPVLQKYGFLIERMESYSFERQVEILAGCNCLIGPHGAGLTNLIFTNKDAHIIEIAGEEFVDCYGFMAKTTGRKFSRIICQQDDRDSDYFVTPDRLDESLKSLLDPAGH